MIAERLDLGPGGQRAGPGLGPRHRRHDARGRATGGCGERPCSRGRVGAAAWPTCCGAGWRWRATGSADRASERLPALRVAPPPRLPPGRPYARRRPTPPTARGGPPAAPCAAAARSAGPGTARRPGGRTRAADSARRSPCPRPAPAPRSPSRPRPPRRSKRAVPASRPGSDRQPSGPAHRHPVGLDQPGVDHMPEMAAVLVVRAVEDEDPQPHADLVGGEAHPVGRVHRGEHVLDQRASSASNAVTSAHGARSAGSPSSRRGRTAPRLPGMAPCRMAARYGAGGSVLRGTEFGTAAGSR